MTNEQILEELRKLRAHNSTPTSGDLNDVDTEVAEIDESIADYSERIAELEAKIADVNNYQYNNENEEREFTVELLQESFASQLETMAREDAEYKSLQELATNIFTDYNQEIEELNIEIADIERRLRKNEIAVRKNIGIRLTDQELTDLQTELTAKKERVSLCEKMKAEYVQDLQNYGELITANNRKREVIIGKQERLNRILEDRKSHPMTIDNHKLRLDKDELFRLKSGLAALQSRKEYITYNPNEEIDKLIAAISAGKTVESTEEKVEEKTIEMPEQQKEEDKSDTLVGLYGQSFEEAEPATKEEEKKDDNTTIVAPIAPIEPQFEDISSHSDNEGETSVDEEKKDDDEIEGLLVNPSDLDEEREAEIEEAKEELKEKKRDKKFVALWKKFSKKAKIITAAALAAGILIIAHSCSTKAPLKPVVDNSKDSSYTQTVDDTKEDKTNDVIETPNTVNDTVVTPSNEQKPSEPEIETPTTEDKGTTTPSTPSTPDTPSIPDTPVTPDVPDTPVTPDPEPEPTKEVETVKLDQGEAVASFDDIINGNINDDTVISHGDEVGKKTDGAELKDYDENGQAEVELEKKDEETKSSSTTRTPEEIKKALEEFMGGELTFDNDDNQWLDEIQSGKTR